MGLRSLINFDDNLRYSLLPLETKGIKAVILNKGSVERGLFVSTTYKTITIEEKKKLEILLKLFVYLINNIEIIVIIIVN